MYVCGCMCVSLCVSLCVCVCVYMCECVCECVSMCECVCLCVCECMSVHVTVLGVLCCFALLTLLASFFLPSHLSLKTRMSMCACVWYVFVFLCAHSNIMVKCDIPPHIRHNNQDSNTIKSQR